MPPLLLDTHAALWALADPDRPSPTARTLLEDEANDVFASAVVVWEAAVKLRVGKLRAPEDLPDRLWATGFRPLGVSAAHAWAARDLPLHHDDPFDRLLVAQAMVEDLPVVSADRHLDAYGVERLW